METGWDFLDDLGAKIAEGAGNVIDAYSQKLSGDLVDTDEKAQAAHQDTRPVGNGGTQGSFLGTYFSNPANLGLAVVSVIAIYYVIKKS